MSGTAGSIAPPVPAPVRGNAVLTALTDVGSRPGVWVDCPLQVTLPEAGTYELDGNLRSYVEGTSPASTYIVGRLFDVTAGVVVPNSETFINQQSVTVSPTSTSIRIGANMSAPLVVDYAVTKPTVLRLQVKFTDGYSTVVGAHMTSDANGRTLLRFRKVA
ncbi:hypothetical protein [Amycolatopsis thermophila]|uniref:Uncharacterized protein n=1 Tax=Amycolatopsis thermophila TaxID=206084 RepID=A0ABU0EMH7_9PSEU|nr:hypothetical protein [Amycolatopsis thermophila]MDQ0376483.1 hypothetical protein [Amycolatopsis thermophila]